MLTREEQETILEQARWMVRKQLAVRRRLEKSEVSPQRAKELMEKAELELWDVLKKVG